MKFKDSKALALVPQNIIVQLNNNLKDPLSFSDKDVSYFTGGPYDALLHIGTLTHVPDEDAFTLSVAKPGFKSCMQIINYLRANGKNNNYEAAFMDAFTLFSSQDSTRWNHIFGGSVDNIAKGEKILEVAFCKGGTFRELEDLIVFLDSHILGDEINMAWRIAFTTSGMYGKADYINIDTNCRSLYSVNLLKTNANTVMGRLYFSMTDRGPVEFISRGSGGSAYSIRGMPLDIFWKKIKENEDLDQMMRYIVGVHKYKGES